jgi:predicted phage gp36 major capsid-like protein
MSDRLKALREERGVIVTQMQALTDLAIAEKRDLTGEEADKHSELFNLVDTKRKNIEVEERKLELARQDATSAAAEQEERAKKARELGVDPANLESDEVRALRMQAFRSYLLNGSSALNADERRALAVTPNTAGGYLLAPQEFVAKLIMALDNQVFIRSRRQVIPVANSNGLGAPSLDNDPADADWTTEILTGSEDSTMSVRQARAEAAPGGQADQGLQDPAAHRGDAGRADRHGPPGLQVRRDPGEGLPDRLGQPAAAGRVHRLQRRHLHRPRRLHRQHHHRDHLRRPDRSQVLAEGRTGTKGEWLFHRDAVKMLSKLKDGEGQYLWRMSVRDGEPDTILGRPLMISEYAPNTFTTGLYVGLFGDFSNYWIADCLDLQIQRLVELYAETNQDGFIGRYEGDGMPVLEEAFARVKLA